MTPLEQQVREALTDEVLINAWIEIQKPWQFRVEPMRESLLTALRPLLEQQAASVAMMTAERDEAREIAKNHAVGAKHCCCGDCAPIEECAECYAWQDANGKRTFDAADIKHTKDCKIAAWSGGTR